MFCVSLIHGERKVHNKNVRASWELVREGHEEFRVESYRDEVKEIGVKMTIVGGRGENDG